MKKIALERAQILLREAERVFDRDRKLADRYVQLAWRILTHCKVRLPRSLKYTFCRRCLTFWKQGVTCRVRIKRGIRVITCLNCGRVYRVPFKGKG